MTFTETMPRTISWADFGPTSSRTGAVRGEEIDRSARLSGDSSPVRVASGASGDANLQSTRAVPLPGAHVAQTERPPREGMVRLAQWSSRQCRLGRRVLDQWSRIRRGRSRHVGPCGGRGELHASRSLRPVRVPTERGPLPRVRRCAYAFAAKVVGRTRRSPATPRPSRNCGWRLSALPRTRRGGGQ